MSWDVLLMNVPPGIVSRADIPDDFRSELGAKSAVLSTLARTCPGIDLTDPGWGILDGDDFSIEFNMGKDDPVDTIMLHVRGGDSVITIIRNMCLATGWRALDTSTGEFMDFKRDPAKGLRMWRQFRDQVMASLEAKGEQVIWPKKKQK